VLRRLYPQAVIIVCGDNDAHGKGQKAAKEAANEVGGRFIIPPNVGQDWNDHLTNGGTL
jgi:putative DNA primase/helicase